MKSILFILVSFLMVSAQLPREVAPSPDSYLSSVDTHIETASDVTAPRMEGSLKVVDNTATLRTTESIMDEVHENQTKLTYLFKKARIQGLDIPQYYDLGLTINNDGEVVSLTVKGIEDTGFVSEMGVIIKTWSFSKVKETKTKAVNLKHLSFLYRRELVMQ